MFKSKMLTVALSGLLMSSAAFSKADTLEDKYWNDFQESGKGIVSYVSALSSTDKEAATWFLTTGGKYGFAKRQANEQERALLESTMKSLADWYVSSPEKLKAFSSLQNPVKQQSFFLRYVGGRIQSIEEELASLKNNMDSLEEDVLKLNAACSRIERSMKEREAEEKEEKELLEKKEKEEKELLKKKEKELLEKMNESLKKITKENADSLEKARNESIKRIADHMEKNLKSAEEIFVKGEERFETFSDKIIKQNDSHINQLSENIYEKVISAMDERIREKDEQIRKLREEGEARKKKLAEEEQQKQEEKKKERRNKEIKKLDQLISKQSSIFKGMKPVDSEEFKKGAAYIERLSALRSVLAQEDEGKLVELTEEMKAFRLYYVEMRQSDRRREAAESRDYRLKDAEEKKDSSLKYAEHEKSKKLALYEWIKEDKLKKAEEMRAYCLSKGKLDHVRSYENNAAEALKTYQERMQEEEKEYEKRLKYAQEDYDASVKSAMEFYEDSANPYIF